MVGGGLVGILQFFLFLLVVVLIIFGVMFIGGVLVSCVSLPALVVFPAVRWPLVALTERTFDARPDSITDWRFLTVYLLSVFVYGFSLVVTLSALIEYSATYDLLPVVAVLALLVVGTLIVVHLAVTRLRLRAVGEWTVYLCLLSGLVLVAAFVVPYLIFYVLLPHVW